MLNEVGLGRSKTSAMFELMDCPRLTTDERPGPGNFLRCAFEFGGQELEKTAQQEIDHTPVIRLERMRELPLPHHTLSGASQAIWHTIGQLPSALHWTK